MKRIRLVNSIEMEKEKAKRISSKQLEAKITAFTILLAVIVMNILWWVTILFSATTILSAVFQPIK